MSGIENVAIIMDGNGRWANERRRPRVWGHVRGSRIVGEIVESAANLGLQTLTLYAFSTENWSRPNEEISTLFKLLHKFLLRERSKILRNNIQFKVIGDTSSLQEKTKSLITEIEEESSRNSGLLLSFAFSYGGRKEIVDAANKFIAENPGTPLTEEDISSRLYRPEAGDVDLMIRTAGDQRISNFMLWQVSYAELYFTDTKWPDFTSKEFEHILDKVSKRERRFGGIVNNDKIEDGNSNKDKKLKAVSNGR